MFKIYFDKDVDLKLIKENLTNKQNRIQEDMNKISQRLENKAYLKNAPIEIVQNDKDLLRDLNIEENKLRSIVSSIN